MNISLRNSIFSWSFVFFCMQSLLLLTSARVFTSLPRIQLWFLWIIATHLLLLAFLLIRSADFVIPEPEKALTGINPANVLTIFRLSAAPVLHYLIVASKVEKRSLIGALLFAVIISLSDMFDGMLARKNQTTRIGKYMDPMADYYILAATSLAMSLIDLLPGWLLSLILFRLILQGVLASIIITKQKRPMHSTILGKVLICSIFILYNLSLLRLFDLSLIPSIYYVQGLVALLILASIIERIIIFARWRKEKTIIPVTKNSKEKKTPLLNSSR